LSVESSSRSRRRPAVNLPAKTLCDHSIKPSATAMNDLACRP
jgi:hypothetical protein